MNRRVSVWKYVRIGKKWRYCKPAIGKNGKIKPDWVIVRGKEERHPEGNFYLHRYDGDMELEWWAASDQSHRSGPEGLS
jgi:hypothetical protein